MNLFLDVLERVGLAFGVAFLGSLTASPVFDNLGVGAGDALKVAVFAGLFQAAIVILALLQSRQSGGSITGAVEVKPDSPA